MGPRHKIETQKTLNHWSHNPSNPKALTAPFLRTKIPKEIRYIINGKFENFNLDIRNKFNANNKNNEKK